MRRLRPHAPTHQYASTGIPAFPLTVVMVPSYRCQHLAGASPSLSSCSPLSLWPSVPSQSCHLHPFALPSVPSSHLSTLSFCLPQTPLYSSPSSFLPITLCPEPCISSPLLPFLSISTKNSTIAPFCLSLQPPLNPSHSTTCSSSLIPAHCSHLSFPHISLSVPATLSLPCRNSLHLSM